MTLSLKPTIYYLHGLGSGPKANTAVALSNYFNVQALAYTPHDFEAAMPVLLESIPPNSLVVGTSMGGYFALKLAERINRLRVLAINPVIPAREGLARFTDSGFEDFVTGTMRAVGRLEAFEDLNPATYAATDSQIQLLAGSEDDVVPPQMVADFAARFGLPFTLIDGMGHRVEQYTPQIVDFIQASMQDSNQD